MGAMADLIAEHDIQAGQVASVRVGTNRHMPNALIHHRPQNELQAKFSMEFCMAILLLDRRAGLAEFTDEVVARPDVRDLVERVTLEVDEAAEAAGSHTMTSLITVRLKDGQVLSTKAEYGKGSPQIPMSDDELVAKFVECGTWGGLDAERTGRLATRWLALDQEPDVSALLASHSPDHEELQA